jgi:dTDP-4-dehydrorhamnose reductase
MRVLITGASGFLGSYLLRALQGSAHTVTAWTGSTRGCLFGQALQPVDLGDDRTLSRAFHAARPEGIIHAAALARVGDCAREPERAQHLNSAATRQLAALAQEPGARLVFVSTDLVFDGEQAPYRESDPPTPVSVYGRTKAEAERSVASAPRGLVVRVSLLYGPSLTGHPTFFDQQVQALREGKALRLFDDEWRTPLFAGTAAQALLALVLGGPSGILHLGGPERLSRQEMGLHLARALDVGGENIEAVSRVQPGEPRPRDVSLDSSTWRQHFPEIPWPTLAEVFPAVIG